MRLLGSLARWLLRLYPEPFRTRQGPDMVDTLEDRFVDRRNARGSLFAYWHGMEELTGLMLGLPREWARPRGVGLAKRAPSFAIISDIRYALRAFSTRPGYTAVIVITLGLGIGANTAIFSVVNGVLLRPLPYDKPDRLVLIWDRFDRPGSSRTWVHDLQVKDLREKATRFDGFAAMEMVSGRILGGDRPVHTDVARVSANFFDLLGVRPALGRTFRPGEDVWGAPWVALVTHDYWTREFGQDPNIIGKSVVVGYPEMEIVGVLPRDFDYRVYEAIGDPVRPEIWIPHQIDYQWWTEATPGRGVALLGRIAPDVTFEEARSDLARVAADQDATFYNKSGLSFAMTPLLGEIVDPVRPALLALIAAVGLVLIIAIANVGTLVLARTHYRATELAVRHSLGAPVGRILRQLVTENVALAVAGGILGLAIASWGIDVLLALAPIELPRAGEVAMDLRVFAFAGVISCVAGIIPGLIPGVHLRRADLAGSLKEGGRAATDTRQTRRMRGTLVVIEIALSVMLVAGAGLMVRSVVALERVDPGFHAANTLTFSVHLMEEYEDQRARDVFFAELTERLSALPSVESVGATTALPMTSPAYGPVFKTQITDTIDYAFELGRGVDVDPGRYEAGTWSMADINSARPGYFAAAGINLVAGRAFNAVDGIDEANVVIDETLANTFWPGRRAVGEQLWVFNTWTRVVGVARHTHQRTLGQAGRPQIYLPYAGVGRTTRRTSMVVRTVGDPEALLPAIREEVAALSPIVPIGDVRTMDDIVSQAVAGRRFMMTLLSVFAAGAVLLAALGIYGVLSFAVGRRQREIAVRLAIGSPARHVRRLVIGQGLQLAAIGLTLGTGGALLLGRLLEGLLFGTEPTDVVALLSAVGTLAAVAMFAAWLPAQRATTLDPASTLRGE